METIISAVQNLGVAVVLCLLMAYFVKYMYDKFMEYLAAEQEAHKQEMSEMTTAVNNNTQVLSNIMTLLQSVLALAGDEEEGD